MTFSAHIDTFARDHLPPANSCPTFFSTVPSCSFPNSSIARANCSTAGWRSGQGEPPVHSGPGPALDLCRPAARGESHRAGAGAGHGPGAGQPRVAARRELTAPGGVLVRGGEGRRHCGGQHAAAARQGADADRAQGRSQPRAVRCAPRRRVGACAACVPDPEACCAFQQHRTPPGSKPASRTKPAGFDNVKTGRDDTCIIAFTSGTTGQPKGTMHFHRDVMAACACWPAHVLRPRADDVFIGSPPLAFTFGLGGLLLFPLAVGASTVLLEKASPDALPAAIAAVPRHGLRHRADLVPRDGAAPEAPRCVQPAQMRQRRRGACRRRRASCGRPPAASR